MTKANHDVDGNENFTKRKDNRENPAMMAVHVLQFNYLYISLSSSAKQQREMTKGLHRIDTQLSTVICYE